MTPDLDSLSGWAEATRARVPAEIRNGTQPAALYGLGFLGRWALDDLAAAGIRFDRCIDGNPALAGSLHDGLPVVSPDALTGDAPGFVFISARHHVPQVAARLDALGLAHVSVDAFYAARDFDAYRQIHDDLLADDRSRQVLRAVLATMLSGSRAHVTAVFEKDQYFCLPQFSGIEREIYVDAGAYVGDSLERFVWSQYGIFSKAICFEPGPHQFAALSRRTERLKSEWALDAAQVELVPAALGEARADASATSRSGQMTSLALEAGGDQPIRIERLDDYLDGAPITFLKADVEGMEMSLLRGAAETIRRHRPKLAICVYHYPPDIPVISRYLQSLVPGYRFALRHHSPQFMETVLYAWTET